MWLAYLSILTRVLPPDVVESWLFQQIHQQMSHEKETLLLSIILVS